MRACMPNSHEVLLSLLQCCVLQESHDMCIRALPLQGNARSTYARGCTIAGHSRAVTGKAIPNYLYEPCTFDDIRMLNQRFED